MHVSPLHILLRNRAYRMCLLFPRTWIAQITGTNLLLNFNAGLEQLAANVASLPFYNIPVVRKKTNII